MIASPAAIAAVAGVAMIGAHMVADHWVQSDRDAAVKGRPGWAGRLACARHVASYTATSLGAVLVSAWALGHFGQLQPVSVAIATAITVITHYVADRREPLRRLAELVAHGGFYTLGTPRPGHDDNPTLGTGAYALDQSWHYGWMVVSAVVTAIGSA